MTQTHGVSIDGDVVTKVYVSTDRDEHLREWAALRAISARAPDLVPTPLELDARPAVSMSLVPGRPLDGALGQAELDALEKALRTLWSLPTDGVLGNPLPGFIARVREAAGSFTATGLIEDARLAGVEWLADGEVDKLLRPADSVIGHGDPNLANYLWDGERVRIVDFEDAGVSDVAVELANLVEHLAGRRTEWTGFIARFAADPQRLLTARRLWSIFCLALLRPGGSSLLRNPPGTADEQARRVLRMLARPGGLPAGCGRRGC
ncbi:Ser/Thr protein kinase RdoA (MazF antagonist) [Kribbella voronezhensis]|uniref:Ser/Thr protein kinase RdoA (MazF antagonist) n=1 Tax=Kribbella voronezhensis TaxID=2512212 RepID=A0A4V3FKB9_9ACTN|nr:aminoglycoside phosphotransferase family protein [Kribbella voronezhensis]TDU89613.1 Ser/Thr protein kinase RdoA (MazF antagonist) [Kribbella voronezhensis]